MTSSLFPSITQISKNCCKVNHIFDRFWWFWMQMKSDDLNVTKNIVSYLWGVYDIIKWCHRFASRPDKELAYGEQNIRTTGALRIETRLRRAITQALQAWLRALHARTNSLPTESKTFGLWPNWKPPTAGYNTGASRLTTGALRPDKEGEQNIRTTGALRIETRIRQAITQALRAWKSSSTASNTFGLRPNWNPPTAGNNTGALRLTNISSFHMLGNESKILDFRFEDDPTLSLWTNRKVGKTGFAQAEPFGRTETRLRRAITQALRAWLIFHCFTCWVMSQRF